MSLRIHVYNGYKRSKKKKKKVKKELFKLSEIPAPHAIKAQLDEYVIGQEQAKKVISVAVYNHNKRSKKKKKKVKKELFKRSEEHTSELQSPR